MISFSIFSPHTYFTGIYAHAHLLCSMHTLNFFLHGHTTHAHCFTLLLIGLHIMDLGLNRRSLGLLVSTGAEPLEARVGKKDAAKGGIRNDTTLSKGGLEFRREAGCPPP